MKESRSLFTHVLGQTHHTAHEQKGTLTIVGGSVNYFSHDEDRIEVLPKTKNRTTM
jgi:hypothetical protein